MTEFPDTKRVLLVNRLKGSKFGCGMGLCGACTVHINGNAARSCVTPVSAVGSAKITSSAHSGDCLVTWFVTPAQ